MVKRFLVTACVMMLPAMAVADGHVTGDAEAGEKVFRKCKACHAVGEGAENKVGPVLNGVVDRAFGAVEGFSYSDALMEAAAEGKAWTPEELDAFLQKPRSYLKGTKMSFAGLRKEDDRANVIAYLASFPAEGS
ncbi:c-type cytochrome [Roseobacter sinensis]|uniref:Cytochrome c family protein n=1 Tax=Roseobacter sinensis TaxID=2931391 RepID=A0ABT3BKW1_9RHOB|nr:cytochrome c family protein [Roseobacter sp. WL0113]MCV3274206.1 cytochrome c family protein [Roseobacter sp. WL0113]